METIYLHKQENPRYLTRVVAFLSALPLNRAWRIRIDEMRGSRTNQQNKALFGCAYPCFAKLGHRPDPLHTVMCCKFFGTNTIFGVETPIRTTTTDEDGNRDVISWDIFSEFYAMVQEVGAEYGVYVPDPDKNWRNNEST